LNIDAALEYALSFGVRDAALEYALSFGVRGMQRGHGYGSLAAKNIYFIYDSSVYRHCHPFCSPLSLSFSLSLLPTNVQIHFRPRP